MTRHLPGRSLGGDGGLGEQMAKLDAAGKMPSEDPCWHQAQLADRNPRRFKSQKT